MTKEEVARILDPETTRDELLKLDADERLNACDEACRMGAAALREQQERENPKPPAPEAGADQNHELFDLATGIEESMVRMRDTCDVLYILRFMIEEESSSAMSSENPIYAYNFVKRLPQMFSFFDVVLRDLDATKEFLSGWCDKAYDMASQEKECKQEGSPCRP